MARAILPKSAARSPRVLTRAQARALDRFATDRLGIPSIVLMENAARAAASFAHAALQGLQRPRVLIVCGTGNNGGDGFAVARHLTVAGVAVRVLLIESRKARRGDAGVNLEIIRRMGLDIGSFDSLRARLLPRSGPRPDLIIDAIFGTGLDRPVTGVPAAAIKAINAARGSWDATVLSLDIPSGLDCDSGRVLGDAVVADATITFAGLKPAFLLPGAAGRIGHVVVASIGVPLGPRRTRPATIAAVHPEE